MVAIPIYYLSGVLSAHVANKLANPKYFISKNLYEQYKKGNYTEEVKQQWERAEKLATENLAKLKSSTAFIGVCTSALLIIPLMCSITIKPLMKTLDKRRSAVSDINEETKVKRPNKKVKTVTFNGYGKTYSYGMKVGGV